MSEKYVYYFGDGKADGDGSMKNLLGGKGANLAEMTRLNIPVPPGFTISTEACLVFQNTKDYPEGMIDQVREAIARLEKALDKGFGDKDNPLLVSVRSGARVSMPGMMDTVLNLGLNDTTVQGLAAKSNNERFAYDSYRRFLQMFGDVVLNVEHRLFENKLDDAKKAKGVEVDTGLDAADLKKLVEVYKGVIKQATGQDFPSDPFEQLKYAINAVFGSWDNDRAYTYRNLNRIPHDWGTAVNVQSMVFGNLGETSGTGVAFTRDPGTGEKRFYGEFLMNAQGEDVVAGTRTPRPIEELQKLMPDAYKQLVEVYQNLENHYRDMQDLEFTIEDKVLFLLQTRSGKRTIQSAVRIAVEMQKEGLIDERTAVSRINADAFDQLLHPTIDPTSEKQVIAKGLPASPGAVAGTAVFTSADAIEEAKNGKKVILVRLETSPEDVGGMSASQGILTSRGGMTSHAAVVGRGMGKCCVVGCQGITVNEEKGYFKAGDITVKRGDVITLDGNSGEVILGEAQFQSTGLSDDYHTLMAWADESRTLGVRANADTPHDARVAREFGAAGIGLCRTEHMFFGEDRLPWVQKMILSKDTSQREEGLATLLPMQKGDFYGILEAMNGLPVTIRLLDPPLHEFLPRTDEEIKRLSKTIGFPVKQIEETVVSLEESNPMLGHRGCRLGITFPEIYRMQARAIFEATAQLVKEGKQPMPEVMIPLVGTVREFTDLKAIVVGEADAVIAETGTEFQYLVGTMIEIPRAAITADEIAKEAQFFSFGTNDLTQMTFGYSRDDVGKFLPAYVEKGILKDDPFMRLDQIGVGSLVKMAVEKGRQGRPEIKLGICGEHGGDPSSVEFCHGVGLNYVSCSPFRVPTARLAAAQAAIKDPSLQTQTAGK
ncbi:MAG: pyruvate, phosphate dikinase [Candidatus Omnitrophica bacterium]|nr:pyruvate, phosphate dikinase [Candidatus Omnitrophota bacterium]